ncbi:unnamed protein product [marine sediment metagenome]|uniref:Ada DNA repair metal-binding domain-containing protein n=1 Tax=marine sediment metagenome TaxID=412755 RepID=X1FHV3_9ZZZZ
MKNIKFLLFIVCLVFSLNVIFFNCSFATLYILKDQEGKDIWITNNEILVSRCEKLGYVIWILKAGGLSQKLLEPESIDFEPQTKVALPPTTELMPASKTDYATSKNTDVFHDFSCSYVATITPENLIRFKTREEAIDSGRRPCKKYSP